MTTITPSNLAAALVYCFAPDQARELVPGCITWGITYAGGQGGQMTEWPSGRGAVCFGGDSVWGEWTADGLLHCDDGTVYDRSGVEVD